MSTPDYDRLPKLTDAPPEELEIVTDGRFTPTESEPMVSKSIRLPLDLFDWLRDESKARGLTWSEFLRKLAEDAQHPDQPVVPVDELEALIRRHRGAAA